MAVITGTAAANLLKGTALNDVITGLGGDDLLFGFSGIDTIRGGEGNDVANGGAGNDFLFGEAGNDILDGGEGIDRLDGGTGDDFINGGGQRDIVLGGDGNDTIYGFDGATLLGGGALISGGNGNDVVYGAGNDQISGDAGNDRLTLGMGKGGVLGGTGNDVIDSGNAGIVDGGAGNDTVVWNPDFEAFHTYFGFVQAADASGADTYDFSGIATPTSVTNDFRNGVRADLRLGHQSLAANRVIDASASLSTVIENAVGSKFADVILGNQAANTLSGGDGEDSIEGAGGADILHGGAGRDQLYGEAAFDSQFERSYGAGNGRYTDLASGAFVAEEDYGLVLFAPDRSTATQFDLEIELRQPTNPFGQLDFVRIVVDNVLKKTLLLGDFVASTGKLAASVTIDGLNSTSGKDLRVEAFYIGGFKVDGSGGVVARQLVEFGDPAPGALNDVLDGGSGADFMAGGLGNDLYIVDNAGDDVIEQPGGGIDRVESSLSYVLPDSVENLTLTGGLGLFGTGNGLNNTIAGNTGANKIGGGAGNDVLNGGAGNDTIAGELGFDTLTGGIGNDRFSFADDNLGADKILDFNVGADDLVVDASAFGGGLTAALSLAATRLVSGATPVANKNFGQFLYDTDDGRLFWDANGNTVAGGAVLVATLTGAPTITGTDFIVAP